MTVRLPYPSSRQRCGLLIVVAVMLAGAAMVEAGARQAWRNQALAAFDEVWQTVADTHYDATYGGVDWPAVRAELRPRAEEAATPDAVRAVIVDMLARLGQSHFSLVTSSSVGQPLPGAAMVPIEVRVIDEGIVVTDVDPVLRDLPNGPSPGDLLVGIDGADVAGWLRDVERSERRSARLAVWQRAFRMLHGTAGTTTGLRLRSVDGVDRMVNVVRRAKPGETVTFSHLPPIQVSIDIADSRTPAGRQVGVIAFNAWMAAVAEPFARAVDAYRQAGGVVVDLRGNAGGLAEMLRGVSGHFLPTPELLGRMRMRGATLEFRANPRRSTNDGRAVEPFAGPLAILVDELTASASECFAGAMQAIGRARVFGRQTMGQALPAVTRELANGDVLMYAVGDFVTSDGRAIEGNGVMPDESVVPSRRALAAGRDPVVEAALAWIDRASGRR